MVDVWQWIGGKVVVVWEEQEVVEVTEAVFRGGGGGMLMEIAGHLDKVGLEEVMVL